MCEWSFYSVFDYNFFPWYAACKNIVERACSVATGTHYDEDGRQTGTVIDKIQAD